MSARGCHAGFTLVELITVMVLSAILGLVVWRNIAGPLRSFSDLTRRAELVDHGETAVQRIEREIRLALPNSVRVLPAGDAVEFLRTATGGRYRAEIDPADKTSDALELARPKDDFNLLSTLVGAPNIRAGGGGVAACLAGDIDCLVVYNTGQPADCNGALGTRSNAYCGDNVAGIAAYDPVAQMMSFDRSDAGTPLPLRSPQQRFYVVDTPITFACGGGQLRRFSAYTIDPVQNSAPKGVSAVLAEHVESCAFTYDPGSSTRAGLVTLKLVLVDYSLEGAREAVTLLAQVDVPNVP